MRQRQEMLRNSQFGPADPDPWVSATRAGSLSGPVAAPPLRKTHQGFDRSRPSDAGTYRGSIAAPHADHVSSTSDTWPHPLCTMVIGFPRERGTCHAPMAHRGHDRPQVKALVGVPVVIALGCSVQATFWPAPWSHEVDKPPPSPLLDGRSRLCVAIRENPESGGTRNDPGYRQSLLHGDGLASSLGEKAITPLVCGARRCAEHAVGWLSKMRVMVPADAEGGNRTRILDPDSAEWVRSLEGAQVATEAAQLRLHAMLLRIARSEVQRRSHHLRISGAELDDVAHQAAADAMVAIVAKVRQFRGESRFTTWAYKFVIFEVSTKIGRHFWRNPTVPMDAEDWSRLPDRFGLDPAHELEWRDLVEALHWAVDEVLTDRQRRIFVAIVLNAVPLDVLVLELGSNRNAIYKTLFDARRKLRTALVAKGFVDTDSSESA